MYNNVSILKAIEMYTKMIIDKVYAMCIAICRVIPDMLNNYELFKIERAGPWILKGLQIGFRGPYTEVYVL